MKQIYEIRNEMKPLISRQKVSVQYHKTDLSGLVYLVSQLYRRKILVFASKEDLKRRVERFELNDSCFDSAMELILENFPGLKLTNREEELILFDPKITPEDSFKIPISVQMTYRENIGTGVQSCTLLQAICFLARKFKKSVVCEMDLLDPKQFLEIELGKYQKFGNFIHNISAEVPGITYNLFEDFLHFSSRSRRAWLN